MELSEKLYLLRKHVGFSQEYMAQKLNVSQSTYNRMEKNPKKISIEDVEKICEALQLDLNALLQKDNISTMLKALPR